MLQNDSVVKNHINKLIHETSPYLRQHAHNPVNWYPWGDEAIERARQENKPLLISIGYSTCHWCHVMEKESFENEEIAEIQNKNFINIKIDREERPDLDEIYMNAVQMLTGRGGWPLNVFLTPDLKPFYGGTYFPPTRRYNMPGWPEILQLIANYYKSKPEEVQDTQDQLQEYLSRLSQAPQDQSPLNTEPIKALAQELGTVFDPAYGGFGAAPKFPHSTDIQFLLRHYKTHHDSEILNQALFTLEKMARGGMYDQLGGGFHRYSTDEKWLIPHFEKMLYDNALLLKAYVEARVLTGNTYYQDICHEICRYVSREMTHESGVFYAAQDADSEGVEGEFFVWTTQQIEDVLGPEKAKQVCAYYDVTQTGNFENGKSALWIPRDLDSVAQDLHISKKDLVETLKQSCEKLFQVRDKRIHPATDKKIILSWNSLMIGALAQAGFYLSNQSYIDRARRAKDFLWNHMLINDELYRIHSVAQVSNGNGKATILAFLEDYAYFTEALIDLFEATGDPKILLQAQRIQELTDKYFGDKEGQGYYFTREAQKNVIIRSRTSHDGATPSPQSVAVMNLLRLGKLLGKSNWTDRANKLLSTHYSLLLNSPRPFTKMITCLDFHLQDGPEIVIVGSKDDPRTQEFIDFFRTIFLPHSVLAVIFLEQKDLWRQFELYQDKLSGSKATVYVCRNHVCEKPIETIDELKEKFLI